MDKHPQQQALRGLDLRALGLTQVAYIKPTVKDGQPLFAIHGADGQLLGMSPTWQAAFAAIREYGLEAAPLH